MIVAQAFFDPPPLVALQRLTRTLVGRERRRLTAVETPDCIAVELLAAETP